ncbi:MAG: class I SAM-dependent methyltransferase family protein [Halodesulfurarchaeum sp.]
MVNLAAVVSEHVLDATIASLREEGVYDPDRRIRSRENDTVEIPVTAPPENTRVRDVVDQSDPEPRLRTLADHLRDRGFSADEIERAPNSWAVVGDVILVRFGDCERREAVGEALLSLHHEADTVVARGDVKGEKREPTVTVVAGEGDTETVHTEHGTKYALDLASVMFAPGNKAERARMMDVVDPDERVLDMFAGIGYFTLPAARGGATVTAIEKNPTAFGYLAQNARLNEVDDRIELVLGDCRDVIDARVAAGDPAFDRVVMGYYDAFEYLDWALDALAPGGIVHMHEATPEALLWSRPEDRLHAAASTADRAATILDRRRVKSHSEGVWHVVLDARIE